MSDGSGALALRDQGQGAAVVDVEPEEQVLVALRADQSGGAVLHEQPVHGPFHIAPCSDAHEAHVGQVPIVGGLQPEVVVQLGCGDIAEQEELGGPLRNS
eukprot:16436196-Heterocapsa_arctica.AAC.4